MIEKIRNKMKESKGFTLVELIVVLVILAILAALLVPALTGYIDKANKEKITAECRQVVMAAQTEASTLYGKANGGKLDNSMLTNYTTNVRTLSEIKATAKFTVILEAGGAVKQVVYSNSGWTVTYENGAYGDPVKATSVTTDNAGVGSLS